MRITFVTNSLGVGGSEKMILFVSNGLSKLGHEVSIINLNTTGDLTNAKSDNIHIINSDITYKNVIQSNYQYLKFVITNAKKLNAEILVGFLFLGNFFSVLAGRILGIPSIISERSDPFHENINMTGITKVKLYYINKANGAVFQTEGASHYYNESLQRRGCTIPNPIALPKGFECKDYNSKQNIIVSLGRLDNKQKRIDITITAFEKFHRLHKDYKLLIYGDGPDEDFIRQLTKDLNICDCVLFKGVSKMPLQDLNEGKIFIITSEYEGISNTLLEAMALGLPVISTDHSPGGASLLIRNKENGLLVPVNDTNAIAKALTEYAENDKFAQECGLSARGVLTRFHPDRILKQWEDYMLLIANNYNKDKYGKDGDKF